MILVHFCCLSNAQVTVDGQRLAFKYKVDFVLERIKIEKSGFYAYNYPLTAEMKIINHSESDTVYMINNYYAIEEFFKNDKKYDYYNFAKTDIPLAFFFRNEIFNNNTRVDSVYIINGENTSSLIYHYRLILLSIPPLCTLKFKLKLFSTSAIYETEENVDSAKNKILKDISKSAFFIKHSDDLVSFLEEKFMIPGKIIHTAIFYRSDNFRIYFYRW